MNNTRDEESRKKDSPGAPMVPYEVGQAWGGGRPRRLKGEPPGGQTGWEAGGLNKGFFTLELVK